jgi:hypothetical protein
MNVNPAILPTFLLACMWFVLGSFFYTKHPRAAIAVGILLAIPCGAAIFFYTHLLDRAVWYYQVRAMRGVELAFSGVGFLGGAVQRWNAAEERIGRMAVPAIFATILLIPFVKPIIKPIDLDALQDKCKGDVCLQSSGSTCGPAGAASILRSMGQNATEKELAKASYTYSGGTEAWYLARALRQRGVDTEFVINKTGLPAPSIAGVKMGGGHFIAILKVSDASVTAVDPLSGEITATPEELRARYDFTGFFLTVRDPRR